MLLFLIGCAIGLDTIIFTAEDGQDYADLSDFDIDDVSDDDDQAEGPLDGTQGIEDEDLDGDGYSTDEGDCDDADETIHPAALDDCNGIDDNCDGQVDELGAWDESASNPAIDIGEVPNGYSASLYGLLFPDGDTDTYVFYVSDGFFGWFGVTVEIFGVSGDADATLRLDLLEGSSGQAIAEIASADDGGVGESELINFYGTPMYDDSGWYQVTVTAADGSDCMETYELIVSFTD